jgi:hypothetical protein
MAKKNTLTASSLKLHQQFLTAFQTKYKIHLESYFQPYVQKADPLKLQKKIS